MTESEISNNILNEEIIAIAEIAGTYPGNITNRQIDKPGNIIF